MIDEKEYKTIKKILIAFEFEHIKSSGSEDIWEQSIKSLTFRINAKKNCFKYYKKQFHRLIVENFSDKEIRRYLEHFIKKNKVRFNKRSQTKILRIIPTLKQSAESDFLASLLPKETKHDYMDYSTPIEFSEKLKTNIQNKLMNQLDVEVKKEMDKLK